MWMIFFFLAKWKYFIKTEKTRTSFNQASLTEGGREELWLEHGPPSLLPF